MVTSKRERAPLNISRQTKDDLDSIKHSGQSYDGLIKDLIKFWQDKSGEYVIQVQKGVTKEEESTDTAVVRSQQ